MNRIKNYIHSLAVVAGIMTLGSCSDNSDSIGAKQPSKELEVKDYGKLDPDATIRLGVRSLPKQLTTTTRGFGSVGDMEGSEETIWRGDTVYIYAIHALAPDLTDSVSNPDAEIPTYLMGGEDSDYCGTMAITPVDAQRGYLDIPNLLETNTYGYYPINGAYNFMGYFVADAEVSERVVTPEKITIGLTYDGSQDILLGNARLTDEETEKLGGDPEKAFSAYSARRDVQPNVTFEHAMSRLSFHIIAGDEHAALRDASAGMEPRYKIESFVADRKYHQNDIFAYGGSVFLVIQSFPSYFSTAELFGNDKIKDLFLRKIDFDPKGRYTEGDLVHWEGKLYRMNVPYRGTGEPDWTLVSKYRWTPYTNNSSFADGLGITHDNKHWIVTDEITADENKSWESILPKVAPYARGVFVTDVRVKDVISRGDLVITPKGISFEVAADTAYEKSTFVLRQRQMDEDGHILYRDSLVTLGSVAPVSTSVPTPIGEGLLVPPLKGVYKADVTICEYVDRTGDIMPKNRREKVYTNLMVTTQEMAETGFEPGKNYDITVKVFALEEVKAEVTMSGWKLGESIYITPDEDITEIEDDYVACFFGSSDKLPEDCSLGYRIEMKKEGGKVLVTDPEARDLHWLALPEGYAITAWKSQTLASKDYADKIQIGEAFMFEGLSYRMHYVDLTGWRDTYSLTVTQLDM